MIDQQVNFTPDDEAPHFIGYPWSEAELKRMSHRFVAAMAAAIRAGDERPPRVGIDRTPGTKKPRFVSAGGVHTIQHH